MSATTVTGNARITGSFGAVIFVLLFVEGTTVLRVDDLISAHVFVGVLLVPFAIVKLASTGYRFARYYSGQPAYVEKGPPPLVLRLLGPVVSVMTVIVLATGVAAVLNRGSHWLSFSHKASFVIWFGAMTLHVLGHVLETPRLALADWRRGERGQAPGATIRLGLLAGAVAVAIPLAISSLSWAHHWQQVASR